jgi:hypothetical protein
MTEFTHDEIEDLYAGKVTPRYPSHSSQHLSHQMISAYELVCEGLERLYDDETHKDWETMIENRRHRLTGLTKDEVDRDEKEAFRTLMNGIANRVYYSLFPNGRGIL